MPFWIAAAVLAGAVALLIVLAFRRGEGAAGRAARPDLAVYRGQLAEVARDEERGLLSPQDAERTRAEIARRLLEADAATEAGPAAAARPAWLAGTLLALGLIGGAFWLYARLGTPGYPDQPLAARFALSEALRAERPSQAEMEAAAPPVPVQIEPADAALLDRLRATVRDRPGDLRGQELLAQSEAAAGDFAAAARAQGEVVRLKGAEATAADRAAEADLMIAAAGGRVSPEAEAILMAALRQDPSEPVALFHGGRLFDQLGRPDLAFRAWRRLLELDLTDAPWVPLVESAMPRLAYLAGEEYTPPAAAPGPSAADVEAAGQMAPAEREAMIRGMVDRLSDRMSREGGPPEDWARLIASLGVLGETDRARGIWAEARELFAARPEALAAVRAAAEQAGVAQ